MPRMIKVMNKVDKSKQTTMQSQSTQNPPANTMSPTKKPSQPSQSSQPNYASPTKSTNKKKSETFVSVVPPTTGKEPVQSPYRATSQGVKLDSEQRALKSSATKSLIHVKTVEKVEKIEKVELTNVAKDVVRQETAEKRERTEEVKT